MRLLLRDWRDRLNILVLWWDVLFSKFGPPITTPPTEGITSPIRTSRKRRRLSSLRLTKMRLCSRFTSRTLFIRVGQAEMSKAASPGMFHHRSSYPQRLLNRFPDQTNEFHAVLELFRDGDGCGAQVRGVL